MNKLTKQFIFTINDAAQKRNRSPPPFDKRHPRESGDPGKSRKS
ncbi:MAG: hypothetical protein HW380_3809 [Magnetococcales bacterium]|nr:hypothetical protein [Magnetococcales bacterium]